MAHKAFTVDEANALVPALTQTFREIDAHKYRIRDAGKKIEVLELLWGEALRDPANPDHKDFMTHRETVDREFGGNKFTIKLSGKVEGDTIKGEIELPNFGGDGGTQKMPWNAKRVTEGGSPGKK